MVCNEHFQIVWFHILITCIQRLSSPLAPAPQIPRMQWIKRKPKLKKLIVSKKKKKKIILKTKKIL